MGIFDFLKKKNKFNKDEHKSNTPNSVSIIDDHLNVFFDEEEDIVVFHEIVSEIIHRDVFFIKSSNDRPYHILLSCGMSALPMETPPDENVSKFCEVMFLLPKEWKLEEKYFKDEKVYWPIRLMKEIMMLPHSDNTWFGYGHTYSYGKDEEFAEGVGFVAVILLNSLELSEEFTEIKMNKKESVDIFTLIPLYKEELEFKLEHGTSKLLEKFDENNIGEILSMGRKNVCT